MYPYPFSTPFFCGLDLLFCPNGIAYFVLTNERLSFICNHVSHRYCHAGRGGQKKSRRYHYRLFYICPYIFTKPTFLPKGKLHFSCETATNPTYLSAGTLHWSFNLGGGNGPPRKRNKRVPLMRFLLGGGYGPPRET